MHDFYREYVTSGQAGVRTGAGHDSTQPYHTWLMRRVRVPDRSGRIIDAACGSGRLVAALLATGYSNVVGVDISAEQIAVGEQRGVPGLVRGDVIAFLEAEPNGNVTAVFALDFLEHLDLSEALRFLTAVRRCLQDDGVLVLHVPNGQSPFSNAVRYADVTHTRAFTRRSLEQLLFPARLTLDWIEEGRPIIHGPTSLVRYIIWRIGRGLLALWFRAETGAKPDALSQNFTALVRPRLD